MALAITASDYTITITIQQEIKWNDDDEIV